MKTYTYSEARQQFASVLDEARRAGQVRIRRRDGQLFVVQPAAQERSPLDVPGVATELRPGEVAGWLRSEREAGAKRLLDRSAARSAARTRRESPNPRSAKAGRRATPRK